MALNNNKRAQFEQYLMAQGVNIDNFEEAREILVDNISIPEYFKVVVGSNEDLNYKTMVCCILHDETTPSFKYHKDSQLFHCYGCGTTGTVVELHFRYRRRDFPKYTLIQAVEDLAKMFKIKIPDIFEKKEIKPEIDIKAKQNLAKKVITAERTVPIKVLKMEAEKELNKLKKMDKQKYISIANKIDEIEMLGVDLNNRYNEILTLIKTDFKG